jgi:two-component system chemotaxis sensor kinase CheA
MARFIWSRIDVPGRAMVLAAGFDERRAKFQPPFDAGDAAHLRNAAQQLEGLISNTLLVQELARERDILRQTNVALEHRDRELHALADELRGANEHLEVRVRDRTEALGRRNHDMRLVLDNVTQALLTLDGNGKLAAERSACADEWFGPYEGSPSFEAYIGRIDSEFAKNFALAYDALCEQVMPLELCLDQMPRRLCAGRRLFDCTYRPLPPDNRGLLIVIDDVTEETRLAQEEAEQTELLAMFKGLTGDREGFLTFFEETTRMVGELAQGDLDDEARVRHLHTLKGTAAMHGAQLIAEICHRAEDALEINPEGIAPLIARLEQRWAEIQRMLATFLDEENKGRVEVSQRALDHLSDDVRAGLPLEEITRRLAALALEPVERPLARLAHHASKLAARLGKGDLSVAVEATGVRGDRKRLRPLWSALVHLIRNAIDHGIEPADERRARGKSAGGQIVLRASEGERGWSLEVEDDGRGIDWTRIRELARTRGLRHDTGADLVRIVLEHGLSTRSSVTATSGRGVGVAGVNGVVKELGGVLSVSSREGAGTCWHLTFPTRAANDVLRSPAFNTSERASPAPPDR